MATGTGKTRVAFQTVWLVQSPFNEKYPEKISLSSVMPIYRNLRENYEFRLKYEEAEKFFIREMEIKRNYSEIPLNSSSNKLSNLIGKKRAKI